ncbi:MAG: acyl-CoA dehydratase activase [Candidatus Glassbacteria bacterium]
MLYSGVDVGSLSTEVVIIDDDAKIISSLIILTGPSSRKAAIGCWEEALRRASLTAQDVACVVSTGYGRKQVPFSDKTVTEITCHARGAKYFHDDARTIIDIGGQDTKVIRIDADGRVVNFLMNDKCAAGTGRFLEVMSETLEVDLEDMGRLSLTAKKGLSISSMCTVFAESEVISLIAEGKAVCEILWGLHDSVALRTMGLLDQIGREPDIFMSGGVAKNSGVVEAVGRRLGEKIHRASDPQIVGAMGAALIAKDLWESTS